MELGKIVKFIRNSAAMSQEELADDIGVSRLTVIRWESGMSEPNNIAQTKIYDIAKERGIQFFDLILSDMPEHKKEGDRVILYHGSRSGIDGPIGPKSRDLCDFGKGFYMGTNVHQPLTMIFSSKRDETPGTKIYTMELDLSGLSVLYIPAGIEWAMLVAFSRGKMKGYAGSALYERYSTMLNGYDVAVGRIADDKIFTTLDFFFDGFITDKGVVECLSVLPLGEQYVALTEKACDRIRIIEERGFSELERLCIREISERNRERGMTMADDIRKSNRRDGRFFDEIMRDAI
jgi:transcriptional regulator with XRE-family HTH domain